MDFSEAWDDTCSNVGRAARAGLLTQLEQLIQNGSSVDIADNRGWRPLHEAAAAPERLEILEELLKHENTVVDWRTYEGETALLLACKHRLHDNGDEAVQLLLQYNASPNIGNNEEVTPLLLASQNKSLSVVKLLLDGNADPNIGDYNGWRPLHQAAVHGQMEVLKCLLDKGANVDAQDDCGMTPIFIAAQHGQESCLLELIRTAMERGQSSAVNIGAENRATPLIIAAQHGYSSCLQILLDNEADPNLRTTDNATALHFAVQGDHADCLKPLSEKMNLQPLIAACHPSIVESCEIPPEELGDFICPLHLAVEWESYTCLQILLDIGFSPDSIYECSNLPIDFLPADITRHESALSYAVYKENKKAVSVLLNAGATCDAPTPYALHPVVRALSKPSPEILNMLLEHGSNVNYCRPLLRTNEILLAAIVTQFLLEQVLLYGCDPQLCFQNDISVDLFASSLVMNADHLNLIQRLKFILQFVVMNGAVQNACSAVISKAKSFSGCSDKLWHEILKLDQPSSLKHSCRIRIRQHMYAIHGPRFVKRLRCLTIPSAVEAYISFNAPG